MQARPADLFLLDNGDVQASGGAVQRGCVSRRAPADDDYIELFSHWP